MTMMKRILISARWVITARDDFPFLENGAVIVENGLISRVGALEELVKQGPFDAELGSPGEILLPGLVNAHHHVGRYFRDGLPDLPLEIWLLRLKEQLRFPLSPEETYYSNLWSCLELIRSGITGAVVFHSEEPGSGNSNWEAALKAYQDAGMRVAFCLALADQNRYVYEDDRAFLACLPPEMADQLQARIRPFQWEEYFASWKALFQKYHGWQDRIWIFLAPSGVQWCSDELLKKAKAVAKEYDTGMQMHLAETRYQQEYALRRWGKSLVAHLEDLAFLGPELSCAHCVWLEPGDFQLMAARGATVVHNPGSNLRLGSGISPVAAMMEAGVAMAFGLDGTGFSDNGDIFSDLRLAMLLQRLPGIEPIRLSARELLRMAACGGARALLMEDKIGRLEPGKYADLVLLEGERIWASPYLNPGHDPYDVVLQRALSQDVKTVMVGGRLVMQDRVVLGIDTERLKARLQELSLKRNQVITQQEPWTAALEKKVVQFFRAWDEKGPPRKYIYNLT